MGVSEKIELAVNYSPQAAELVRSGAVEVDRFKCPPWPGLIAEAERLRPAYVHFDFQAAQGRPTNEALERADALRRSTRTPWVNTHFAPLRSELEGAAERGELALERALADVAVLTRRFGPEEVVIENVPWEPSAEYELDRVGADPELVRRLVEESGAGFLLDLAHARFAAEELGTPLEGYLEALPVERVRELHVTGLGHDATGRRRDHLPLTGRDVEILEGALDHVAEGRWARPWAVALEYGGVGEVFEWRSDPEVLAEDLPRVAALLAERGLRE